MIEKRRFPRLHTSIPVMLRHQGQLFPACLSNISKGGMRILTDHACISKNHPIEIIFDLDSTQTDIIINGHIKYLTQCDHQYIVGYEYSNLFSTSHRNIAQFIHDQLPLLN